MGLFHLMMMNDTISSFTPGLAPLMKGGAIEKGLIRGIATSERRDLQQEILRRDGADIIPFLGSLAKGGDEANVGAISLEHPVGVFNPIGEPVDLEKGVTPAGDKCYYLTSRLWVDDDKLASDTWDKILAIQKASKKVRLGYSVEGRAVTRNPTDRRVIEEWTWANTVVTGAPRNRDTFFDPIFASLRGSPAGRAAIAKAMADMGMPLAAADFVPQLGPGGGDVNGIDLSKALQLGHLCEKLGLSELDLTVGSALKGSASWAEVLRNILLRVAGIK